jgi:hypothetical protein
VPPQPPQAQRGHDSFDGNRDGSIGCAAGTLEKFMLPGAKFLKNLGAARANHGVGH